MTENQKKVYNLLKQKNTLLSLAKELELSPKQTYRRIMLLENKGFNIFRKDYSNGDISFGISNTTSISSDKKVIYTEPNNNLLRVGAISDLHLGNSLQNIEALNLFYNFCVKNNIHIIFNTGDIFQGLIPSSSGRVLNKDYETQFEEGIKNYPFEKNIINYCVLGNHDHSYLYNYCLDLKKAITKKRYDILPISYKFAEIKIKNEKITLKHKIDKLDTSNYFKLQENRILIQGHSHFSKQNNNEDNNLNITIPSLSNVTASNSFNSYPQFNLLNMEFDQSGLIKSIIIETYIIINKQVIKTNENYVHFNNNIIDDFNYRINYEEKPTPLIHNPAPKALIKRKESLSQIEKFNNRCNIK